MCFIIWIYMYACEPHDLGAVASPVLFRRRLTVCRGQRSRAGSPSMRSSDVAFNLYTCWTGLSRSLRCVLHHSLRLRWYNGSPSRSRCRLLNPTSVGRCLSPAEANGVVRGRCSSGTRPFGPRCISFILYRKLCRSTQFINFVETVALHTKTTSKLIVFA